MLDESVYERIRRAYYVEKKSINRIAQEKGYSRQVVTKIVHQASPKPYQLTRPRPAPVSGNACKCTRNRKEGVSKQRYFQCMRKDRGKSNGSSEV